MNTKKRNIILLILVVIIVIIPFVLYSNFGENDGYFTGADDAAGEIIIQTGYKPWFSSIWEPPSSEVSSLLFAVQAALGALIIGYFLGYWRGKSKHKKEE
jgi:cobalt/nickel transport protein